MRRLAKRYTAEHETVSFDDTTGLGVISITDHAQEALGDVVFVELPVVGTEVSQGGLFAPFLWPTTMLKECIDQIGAVESVKAASDIVKSTVFLLSFPF